MPTYEYICKSCNHAFERFESITAAPNKLCPKCKKKKAERQISAGGGFLFKGSGFYVTDYKKAGQKSAEEKAADSKPAETKPAEAKSTDTKPAETKPAVTKPAAESKPAESKSAPVASKSAAKSKSKS